METTVQVSIVCNTYNQHQYIRDALDSFVMQQTNFAYEILVHDDASTDGTADIIREYERLYPHLVKPIYQEENQYSKKVNITNSIQIPRAKGKYIAFCEGDDYWTDSQKLQKQFDALEAHPDIDMCAHAAVRLNAETNTVEMNIAPRARDTVIPVEDVILGEGGFVATNSIMFRTRLNESVPRFRRNLSIDYTLQIHGSLRGGLLYLSDYMAVYRYLSAGSWSRMQRKNKEQRVTLLERKQNMLRELNEDTQRCYETAIQKRELQNEFEFHYGEKDYKTAFEERFRPVYRKHGMFSEMKYRIKAYLPWTNGITLLFQRKHSVNMRAGRSTGKG